ncbi:MAG TPA: flagellar hook-associated protein FlgL [Burkholderiales bacterium]|jgi:flagellar hook-associated protein 3 FlgL|nr:flagellar hook-associated protein FlgL [Burkholderiales bacterium]
MRISTSMIYDLGSASMADQQSALFKTQEQMSSSRRMLSPADDPAAASTALKVSQGLAVTQQQQANQQAANSTLSQAESVMGSTSDLLQSATQLLLSAQNGTMSQSDRDAVVTQLQGMQQQLLALANSRDGAGGYLFAGYNENTQPFVQNGSSVAYNGDDGVRTLEVAPGRSMDVSSGGADTFMRVKNGNGVFATAAGAGNTGGGVIDSGSVTDPSALTGHAYQLNFSVSGGVTTYDVLDTTAGTTVSSGNAFTAGSAITVDGQQFTVGGQPGNGDNFTVSPSSNESMFQMLADGIAALKSGASPAVRTSAVNSAVANMYQAQNQISLARAALGSNMAEITTLTSISASASTTQQTRLGDLTSLDYNAATTQLTEQTTALQAAQQTFGKISKMSLFSYLA